MTLRPRGRPNLDAEDVMSDEDLLDAVLLAFAESGFEGTSIREVARRLGISHNLIPQRFGSKTDLWYAAVRHGFTYFDRELVEEGKRLGSDELVIFRGLLIRLLELNALHPSLLRIINQEAGRPGPRLDYIFTNFIRPAHEFMENWMEQLAAKGRIRKPPPGLLYFLINHGAGSLFVFHGLAERLTGTPQPQDTESIHQQAEQLVGIFLEGLLPRQR